MQEEVDQKTIALAVKTGKLTAQVLQAAIRKYLAARQKGTGKAHHGQQSLRQLKKDGSALSNIEITGANIGLFKPCAKKYDIDFTLRKDRTTHPPRYIVIFKSKQADNLEQAFKEFTAKKLKQQERPSIRKTLAVLKEKATQRSTVRPEAASRPRRKSRKGGCHDEAGNEKADNRQPALPAVCFTCSASWDRPTGWRLGRTCRKSYCTLRTAFPLPLKAPPPASTCSIWRWAWPVRWHCG